ncbi:hypothetical protein AAG906_039139 [Vitis piasezkii]
MERVWGIGSVKMMEWFVELGYGLEEYHQLTSGHRHQLQVERENSQLTMANGSPLVPENSHYLEHEWQPLQALLELPAFPAPEQLHLHNSQMSVSIFVARTSKTPLSIVKMLTSKVPPPRSKTRMFFSPPFLSKPYAIAAAVGSLIISATFRLVITPASLVACLWASL